MTTIELVTTIKSMLELGISIVDIAKRLCNEHAGYTIPSIKDFDEETLALANKSKLKK